MNIIFFDTETTGLPMNWKAAVTDVDNWPRIIQLAFEIASEDSFKPFVSSKTFIKPNGWEVPKQAFWIDHGYSTERCAAEGIFLEEAVTNMMSAIERFDVDIIVAHNMAFDSKVLGAEMIRSGLKLGKSLTRICTMDKSTDLCKLPGKFGYKFPKLEELHRFLFEKDFEGAHDAGNDVAACRVCFFELVKRGIITLPKIEIV